MLTLTIKDGDLFDEVKGEFVSVKGKTIQLEHSLISVSKWESKWKKSFLSTKEKTLEESIDYIRCMTLTPNVEPLLFSFLTKEQMNEVHKYIEDDMTATTFNDRDQKSSREIVTSELIYYWMFVNQIPKECEKWHLNRLMTLIKIFGVKSQPGKKMSKRDLSRRNRSLNAQRRAKTGSRG